MATTRSFAYNAGAPISQTTQVGDIAAGNQPISYDNGLGWWNGPDENLGYVICYAQTTGSRTAGNGAFNVNAPTVGFWRSPALTDESFLDTCNLLFSQGFTDTLSAKDWLTSNGYWTSYVTPLLYLDAGNSSSYSGSGSVWTDLVGGKQFNLINSPIWSGNVGSIRFSGAESISTTVTAAPGTASATYEWWFYQTDPTGGGMLQTRTNSFDADGIDVTVTSGSITVSTYGAFLLQGAGTVNLNTWYHIALVRNGSSVWKVFLDGVSIGTFNFSNTTGTELVIGRKEVGSTFFNGFITNFRYVKGVAVYTTTFNPSTNNLTTTQLSNVNGNPSEAISANTDVQLLLNTYTDDFLKDGSFYNLTLDNPNGASSITDSPFISGGYIKFSAPGQQYASCSTSLSDLSNWSVGVWHYYTGNNTGSSPCIVSEVYTGGFINYILGNGSDTSPDLQTGFWAPGWILTENGYTLTPGDWYYIVGTYDGDTLSLYVNNTLVESTSGLVYTTQSSGAGIYLMSRWDNTPTELWDGYLSTVAIYDKALNTGQIASIFDSTKSRYGL